MPAKYRADNVGSFLRPKELLRPAFKEGAPTWGSFSSMALDAAIEVS